MLRPWRSTPKRSSWQPWLRHHECQGQGLHSKNAFRDIGTVYVSMHQMRRFSPPLRELLTFSAEDIPRRSKAEDERFEDSIRRATDPTTDRQVFPRRYGTPHRWGHEALPRQDSGVGDPTLGTANRGEHPCSDGRVNRHHQPQQPYHDLCRPGYGERTPTECTCDHSNDECATNDPGRISYTRAGRGQWGKLAPPPPLDPPWNEFHREVDSIDHRIPGRSELLALDRDHVQVERAQRDDAPRCSHALHGTSTHPPSHPNPGSPTHLWTTLSCQRPN